MHGVLKMDPKQQVSLMSAQIQQNTLDFNRSLSHKIEKMLDDVRHATTEQQRADIEKQLVEIHGHCLNFNRLMEQLVQQSYQLIKQLI